MEYIICKIMCKKSLDVLEKLRAFDCHFNLVYSYDFSTLYSTPLLNLIKQKCFYLIK